MKLEINNIYHMDCLDGMRMMQEQGIIADCLLTDIPYAEVNRRCEIRNIDKGKADIMTFDLQSYLELATEVVKGVFLIFCSTEQVSAVRSFFIQQGCTTRLLIWEKTNPSPMNGQYVYLSGIECCVYAKKKGGTFNGFCKNTVFRYPCGTNELHPTQKPLSLWYELLRDNTDKGQLVLDTCMGSATTAVACHQLQRNYIGFEKDEEYFALGQKRLNEIRAQMSMFEIIA